MIGRGIKKLAEEFGLRISSGVAYGSLMGFSSTFSEGSGYKSLVITTKFANPESERQLKAMLDEKHIDREYRVQTITFGVNKIEIVFLDNPGTMKKLRAFIEWFYPLLKQSGAEKSKICAECGQPIEKGTWKLIGGVAYHLHKDCAIKLRTELQDEHEAEKAERKGSYFTGLIGALIGTAVGAAIWAGVWLMGYMASLVGLAIGVLAERGYTILKGKKGTLKVIILIICVLLGVIAGTLAGEYLVMIDALKDMGITGVPFKDLAEIYIDTLKSDSELMGEFVKNIMTGFLFAALGVFAFIRKKAKETAPTKVKDLKD